MWAKITVLGDGSMCCSNARAKVKSQYLSHMMPNLGGYFPFFSFFFPRPWDKVTVLHNLTRWFWKLSAHVASSIKMGISPKMTSCGPSNFEGDGLHLILPKKIQFFGSNSFVIHITYYDNIVNFLKFVE